MAKHRRHDDSQIEEGAADNLGSAYWTVDDRGWPAVQPDLPEHLANLLAPPIVVGVAPVAAGSRVAPPETVRPSVVAAPPVRTPGAGPSPARTLASGGRHRRRRRNG